MWSAERSSADGGRALRQDTRHRVDAGDLERFFGRHRRQDAWQCPGQQGLARTGRTGHQHVVRTSRGDLERAFGVLLAANLGEVQHVLGDVTVA